MNNALTVSRRGFGLGAAAFGLLLVSGCSRGSGSVRASVRLHPALTGTMSMTDRTGTARLSG